MPYRGQDNRHGRISELGGRTIEFKIVSCDLACKKNITGEPGIILFR